MVALRSIVAIGCLLGVSLLGESEGFNLHVPGMSGVRGVGAQRACAMAKMRLRSEQGFGMGEMPAIERAGVDDGVSAGANPSRRSVLRTAAAIAFGSLAISTKNVEAAEEFAAITEEIEGSDGLISKVSFSYPKSWKYERDPGPVILTTALRDACFQDPDKCQFGDMIARSVASGDNAFVTGFLSKDARPQDVSVKTIVASVFGKNGKFGAYGTPDDVKVLSDTTAGPLRTVEVKFNAFTPGGSTLLKRSVLSVAAGEGPDVYILVATTSGGRYKTSQETLRAVAGSFRVEKSTRAAGPADAAAAAAAGPGPRKSMFAKENAEREQLERERLQEGLY